MIIKYTKCILLILFVGCNQKEMIFSAKQIKYTPNQNSLERELIHEECFITTSDFLKNLNSLSIDLREKLKSKTIENFKVSRKIELKFITPSFLNMTAWYEECYKFEGIVKAEGIKK